MKHPALKKLKRVLQGPKSLKNTCNACVFMGFKVNSQVQEVLRRERPEVQLLRPTRNVSAARGSTGEAVAHGLALGLLRR